jgi:hypothetical protein
MTWFQVVPVALASAAWLFGPGLPLTYGLGLRGLAAWGLAPVLGVGLLSVTAVVADKVGIRWSIPLALVVTAVAAALAVAVGLLLRRVAPPRRNDSRRSRLAAGLGLVPTVVVGAYVLVNGMSNPDQLNQSYDAIFHYNALAYILDAGDASSLTVSTLGNSAVPAAFYPAAWHAIGSLVAMTTGASVVVVANLFSGVIAVLVWPVACLLLVRQIVGPSVAAMAVTGLVSISFTAFPWSLLSFGVLWPNTLAMSLVPAGLAMVLSITGLAREDLIGKRRAIALSPLVFVAGVLAHPNTVFSLAAVALFPVATAVYRWARRLRAEGRTRRAVIGVVLILVALAGLYRFVTRSPLFTGALRQYWAPFETPARAVGEVLLNATNGRTALWALSLLMLVGLVAAWRVKTRRWLVLTFLLTGFLYVLTASINRPDTQRFTGYWYNDSFRLAAMLPVVGVPLVVLGIVLLAEKLVHSTVQYKLGGLRTTTAFSLLLLFGLMVLSRFFYADNQAYAVAGVYTRPYDRLNDILVDAEEQAFTSRIAEQVPEDAVVANNPWDGSAVMLAEIARKPLFRHVAVEWSTDQRLVAEHLADATDPLVCGAVKRLGVRYLLVGHKTFWTWDARVQAYPGITNPKSGDAFELVAADGTLKLYKVVGCDAGRP